MLAELGYDAFAIDLFGKGNRPAEVAARQAETGKLYKDREKMRSLLMGGLAAARELSDASAVVMGYCFGGAAVLEMARSGQAEGIAGYATRSEEHTSELQSLMRISYAVFCLKKQNKKSNPTT